MLALWCKCQLRTYAYAAPKVLAGRAQLWIVPVERRRAIARTTACISISGRYRAWGLSQPSGIFCSLPPGLSFDVGLLVEEHSPQGVVRRKGRTLVGTGLTSAMGCVGQRLRSKTGRLDQTLPHDG